MNHVAEKEVGQLPLKIDPDWRFSKEELHPATVGIFEDIFEQIASSAESPQSVYETVKRRYGHNATSSSTGWAQSDMRVAMQDSKNTALFLESAWNALEALARDGHATPTERQISNLLREAGSRYQISNNTLVRAVMTSTATSTTTAASTPHAVAQYSLAERVGSGGNGDVFRAIRTSPDGISFEWAIKQHRPSPNFDATKSRERFLREVDTLRKLQHRGIVQYVDAGFSADQTPYLVMQLVEGDDLRSATDPTDALDTLSIFRQTLDAAQYLHDQGVYHRDLKPKNIIVRRSDRQPVIVDFGLAFAIDDTTKETLTKGTIGSSGYIPPEVSADPKSSRSPKHDIFALGIILYELFARKLPEDLRAFSPLANISSTLAPLDIVIHRATSTAKDRYSTIQEMTAEFERAISSISAGTTLANTHSGSPTQEEIAVLGLIYELPRSPFSLNDICNEKGVIRAKVRLGWEGLQRRGFLSTYRDNEGDVWGDLTDDAKEWAHKNSKLIWPD